jgi:LemA protein
VAEGQLSGALRGLMAVAESYPQLQASQQFAELQGSLRETEDALQNARRYYNAVVRDLNTRVQTAPTNLFAAMFGLKQRPFFDASPADREAVAVRF